MSKCAGNSRQAVVSVSWIYLSVPGCSVLTNPKLQIPGVWGPQTPRSV